MVVRKERVYMDRQLIEFINENYPKKAKDLAESFLISNIILAESLEDLGKDIAKAFEEKDYSLVGELTQFHKNINSLIDKNDEKISELQPEDYELEQEELEDKNLGEIPNYEDYLVDQNVAYTLYSDLTHKRPKSFTIEGQAFEADSWKEMLLKTCSYLYEKDSSIIDSFPVDKTMNGRKRKSFSFKPDQELRSPRQVEGSNLYIESNLSANGIKQLIVKMLRKYKIALSDFIIYLRADYTDLYK